MEKIYTIKLLELLKELYRGPTITISGKIYRFTFNVHLLNGETYLCTVCYMPKNHNHDEIVEGIVIHNVSNPKSNVGIHQYHVKEKLNILRSVCDYMNIHTVDINHLQEIKYDFHDMIHHVDIHRQLINEAFNKSEMISVGDNFYDLCDGVFTGSVITDNKVYAVLSMMNIVVDRYNNILHYDKSYDEVEMTIDYLMRCFNLPYTHNVPTDIELRTDLHVSIDYDCEDTTFVVTDIDSNTKNRFTYKNFKYKDAKAAALTLHNCNNCTDCTNCNDCVDCTECRNCDRCLSMLRCIACGDSGGCVGSTDCSNSINIINRHSLANNTCTKDGANKQLREDDYVGYRFLLDV